jgi:tagatose-6-phosphate ketose/aldose isomerase
MKLQERRAALETTKLQSMQERLASWLDDLSANQAVFAELLQESAATQKERGYFHTLHEICQQPDTWERTALEVSGRLADLRESLAGCASVVLTGSGSSEYAAACLHPLLQENLHLPAQSVGSGTILLHERSSLPPGPLCLVSLARSGNSPESAGVVELMLDIAPEVRHLIVTCNAKGRLASLAAENPRLKLVVLDDTTNDRSLVMTSSFTNMVVAGRALAYLDDPAGYRSSVSTLAQAARHLLLNYAGELRTIAQGPFRKAVYLGSGCRHGAAREAALKLLEMLDGRLTSFAETCLGLRHGPMCAIDGATLVVCFLSSDPVRRAYETDLLDELQRKGIGWRRVIVGRDIPSELLMEGDLGVELHGVGSLADDDLALLDVMVSQMIGFFRCMGDRLKPDSPSTSGVISRVVNDFTVHRRKQAGRGA